MWPITNDFIRPSCANLFVYGTLCLEPLRWRLIGRKVKGIAARLDGFQLRRVNGADYPAACRKVGDGVDGMLLIGLRPQELDRLDRYEGAEYARTLCQVRVAGRLCRAWVYLWRDRYGRLKPFSASRRRRSCFPDPRYNQSSDRPP